MAGGGAPGRAVHVDSIKLRVESAYAFQRWKLKYDKTVSNLGFNLNLRRYNLAGSDSPGAIGGRSRQILPATSSTSIPNPRF